MLGFIPYKLLLTVSISTDFYINYYERVPIRVKLLHHRYFMFITIS